MYAGQEEGGDGATKGAEAVRGQEWVGLRQGSQGDSGERYDPFLHFDTLTRKVIRSC
jgi:hypothetical protein